MKEVQSDELILLSMRRELTPEELLRLDAHFAAHPEQRALWEEERALSRAVQSIPDVQVSSNFTSRLMQTLDLEQSREARQAEATQWRLPRLFPRLAWASLVACIAVFSAIKWNQASKPGKFAPDVSFAANALATLPNAELLLQDFDAIRELGQVSAVPMSSDDELLMVLQ